MLPVCDLSSNSHWKVQNECLRVKSLKFALRLSEKQFFKYSNLKTFNYIYKLDPGSSEASKKSSMSEANPFVLIILTLLLPIFKSFSGLSQNCPNESSESEIQQSLSEAKTKGNFSLLRLLIILKFLNAFRHAESLFSQCF